MMENTSEPQLNKRIVMPSCLRLSLKTKWFEMTKAGIKTEDYRDITPYWIKRLINPTDMDVTIEDVEYYLKGGELCMRKSNAFEVKKFTTNVMTLGYPKSTDTERILVFEHKGIEIRTGNPEWGAEQDKLYFVIMHGAILA
jgi:hypothetical protein